MIILNLAKGIMQLPMRVMKFLPYKDKLMYQFMKQSAKEFERDSDEFCSIYRRPKYSTQIASVEQETDAQRKTAIIMQGPLISKDNFTVETVKIYGKLYPGALVIVSTWENESGEIINQLKKLDNCEVVLSELPVYSGMRNLNYQIYSTMTGIRKAKELGRKYVFKTRCDFRFVKIGLIDFFVALCKEYPINENIHYQKERIIVGGDVLASYFRAFWVADRFSFGQIDDMYQYWNYEMDSYDMLKSVVREKLKKDQKTWREVTESGLCGEPRIIMNYLKRMNGAIPECSVKNYWEVLKRQFITVSFEETGAYWMKAKPDWRLDESQWKGLYYGKKDSDLKCLCYNWDFAKWLLLYRGEIEYKPEYELFQISNIEF